MAAAGDGAGAAGGVGAAAGAAPGTSEAGLAGLPGGEEWFCELSEMWPGQCLALKCDRVVHRERSEFQDLLVMDTPAFGRVLCLDGVIQCTERDEHSYQEMITHLPLCSLSRPPRRVLVVGGGDGGVLREMSRHASCEALEMAELDSAVPAASKRFLPGMAVGFEDPRAQVHITDGFQFLKDAPEGTYDAVIVDSSDPVGPAAVLFQRPFYEAVHRALRPGGVMCTQGESLWLHLDIIKEVAAECRKVFEGGVVRYAFTTIPTYPSGQIGFMLCSKAGEGEDAAVDFSPRQPPPSGRPDLPSLRYYNAEVHRAAFVLPQFAKEALADHLTG